MKDDFNLNFIIYITHNVAASVTKSKMVCISPSMMKLQNTLTARKIAVSTWLFSDKPCHSRWRQIIRWKVTRKSRRYLKHNYELQWTIQLLNYCSPDCNNMDLGVAHFTWQDYIHITHDRDYIDKHTVLTYLFVGKLKHTKYWTITLPKGVGSYRISQLTWKS